MSEGKVGEVTVLPIAIAAAGVAVVAVGAAAAAALITRAAMTGLVRFSDALDADAARWKEEQHAAEAWAEAVVGVSARNARIGALRAALGKSRHSGHAGGDGVDLPGPYSPAGRSLEELTAWSARADQLIATAEDVLAARTMAASLRRLAGMAGGKSLVPVAAAIAERHPLLAVDGGSAATAGTAEQASRQLSLSRAESGDDGSDAGTLARRTAARIGEQLARLPRDVSDEDYAEVLQKAAQASNADTPQLAEMWLVELGTRVTKATERANKRRDDTLAAGRYLSALRLEEIDATLFRPEASAGNADVRRRLEAVQAGQEELSDELRSAAQDAVLRQQQAADDAFVLAQLQVALEELGYQALTENGASWDTLTVSGPALGDVTAMVGLSGSRLHAELQPGAAGIGAGHIAQWRYTCGELQHMLSGSGIDTTITEVGKSSAPGGQEAAEDGRSSAPRQRERRR
jgi:hypothetical protein